ncbi:MAG: HAD-IC family P-type ATPase [bacterium]|nr:HAD-IC family P-type ATPase [bacterium]
MLWYQLTSDIALLKLESSESGLSAGEAEIRRKKYGKNKLPEEKGESYVLIFLRQFQSPLIYVLLVASIIVFVMGDTADGFVILAVLAINAAIGTFQEGRAKEKLASLKVLTKTHSLAWRNGKETVLDSEELVPGDVIMVREGDQVGADARLLSAVSLHMDEAALTGESSAVLKKAESIEEQSLETADQKNMIWKGTYALSGFGKAVVVDTGVNTVIGKLAMKLGMLDSEMPLKENIRLLTKVIMVALAVISVIFFFAGVHAGNPVSEVLKVIVALAVSFVPEGLPVVVTLILATGVWRMSMRNALVKKLQAVEALGQADVLAVDKTGTITKNQMMVTAIYANGKKFEVGGNGYEPRGYIKEGSSTVEPLNHPELLLFAKTALLTATGSIAYNEEKKEWMRTMGEPTEVALAVFGQKMGFNKPALEEELPQKAEIPFDSRIKYHATVNDVLGVDTLFVAGAPEVILNSVKEVWKNGACVLVTENDMGEIKQALSDLSTRGLRVLALATASGVNSVLDPMKLPELCFVGFAGITDALRPHATQAIKDIKAAGVHVVMITGDYVETGVAVAKEIGIFSEGDAVLSGSELEKMTVEELVLKIRRVSVFARVSPEHKLQIIEAYKKAGNKIAMTGDGVNDALSLAAADLGVAMGKSGTEVAKDAADIVLLDDNMASIVSAIEEGRNIYRSIKKVVLYLFGTAAGEVLVICGAIFLGMPIPLTPGQIIWLNLVTDGFLVVALGLEPKADGLLLNVFKKPSKWIVDRRMLERILLMGFVMSVLSLYLFAFYLPEGIVKASTVVLTVLAVTQWFNVWNVRFNRKSIFKMNWLNNKFLLYATGIVVILQVAVVHVPSLQSVFHTTALSLSEWAIIVGLSTSVFLAEETRKFLRYGLPALLRQLNWKT